MVEAVTRRGFLASSAAVLGAGAAEKVFDGGFAPVTEPGIPFRKLHLVPPGAKGIANFRSRCVGCQLCVTACPEKVLRPATELLRLGQPEMGFEHGYCRPECVKCSSVCPTGAILPITRERKAHIHIGHAIWHQDRCLAVTEGITCDACSRHCPAKAITRVPLRPNDPKSPMVPSLDKTLCLGCGACEYLCPSRPLPAMTVKGFEVHHETVPMSGNDAIAEALRRINSGKVVCIFVKDGVFVGSGIGNGVKPLLQVLDHRSDVMKDAVLVDKVVGRAAAAIAVYGGVREVHALIMSEGAKTFLEQHGIKSSAVTLVSKINNNDNTGTCPLEVAVAKLDDPKKMVDVLRGELKRLAEKTAVKVKP